MLSLDDLADLPSPFYRVAVKALIFDAQGRLLLVQNDEHTWELPGGGWEHDESLEECLRRELLEEAGATLMQVTGPQFVFAGQSDHGWRVLRVVVGATIAEADLTPGDNMVACKYFSRDEFMNTELHVTDTGAKEYVDQIWR